MSRSDTESQSVAALVESIRDNIDDHVAAVEHDALMLPTAHTSDASEVLRLRCQLLDALAEIEAWKDASGLIDGHGDPDGITPDIARKHWEAVERERDALRNTECKSVARASALRKLCGAKVEMDQIPRSVRGGAFPVYLRADEIEALRHTECRSVDVREAIRKLDMAASVCRESAVLCLIHDALRVLGVNFEETDCGSVDDGGEG